MSVPDLVIRDAIETAFAVVVAGMRLRPPILPPSALKPLVRFQKIPPAALGQVRRAVEADEDLRRRVAIVATEELVGRAGWLWIHRPEGWEAELAGLAAEEAAAELAAGQEKAERSAQRRVEAAEQAARAAAAEVAGLRTELTGEREQRRQAEEGRSRLERRAGQLDVELGGARRRLVAADARTAAAEDAVEPLQHRIHELEAEVTRLTEEIAAAREGASAASSAAAARSDGSPGASSEPGVEGHPRSEVARSEVAGVEGHPRSEVARSEAGRPGSDGSMSGRAGGHDRESRLATALAEAAQATAQLTAALAAASAAAGWSGSDGAPAQPRDLTDADPGRRLRSRRLRRVPLALPGGVWADAPEAALHLVKSPGVLLVVDGYNVAKLGWPGLALADQRSRVLDALDELAARYGTDVHVVFDGADVGPVATGRRYLRVEFSPAGVTADEVIVRLAEDLPVERPVVVATNDGEVRAGARAAGANIVSSEQLLAIARR